jgi:signal transduction histidine kinase
MPPSSSPDRLSERQWTAAGPVSARSNDVSELIREFDWSATPLGPVAEWPQSLKTPVQILLSSRFAMWMGWGADLTFLYNDAYARMTLGAKHPWALGRPAREVWAEIWSDIGPRIQTVLDTGTATWDEALLLFLERSGYREETYHTFSYSPLADDTGRVCGMLCVVVEETERIIGERRLGALRDLAAVLSTTNTVDEVVAAAESVISANPRDLPFTITYLFEDMPDGGPMARLASSTGIEAGHPAAPIVVADGADTPWPIASMRRWRAPLVVDDLRHRFGDFPAGTWDVPCGAAVVVPIAQQGQGRPAGCLIAGINPYRAFDAASAGFVELVAGQIASSLTNARAYEAERERAEMLAELDRAKTTFFSNVSHELRTPLTLMLGPTEDLMAESAGPLTDAQRGQLDLLHRNQLRLLKLVNNLLDFSRLEAGRTQAMFEATDLAARTVDLASTFRSVVERAGLRLVVDAPPLPADVEPAFVDRDMWEKIVLNLLSNAFKHTFAGDIAVSLGLTRDRRSAELVVHDTGVGIAPEHVTRIFDRFHRVPNAKSRTHEGTGIGLSLVRELVRLHGGEIDVTSEVDVGTTFRVRVPLGSAHLAPDRIVQDDGASVLRSAGYVEEASRWLPASADWIDVPPSSGVREFFVGRKGRAPDRPAHVLFADDNADMRAYVTPLLQACGWRVDSVADGESALAALNEGTADGPYDLVLSDVMMPRMDGFEMLRAIRGDQRLSTTPVILLSARAGEEARVEGLDAGADDYLVKPFSARELVARVRSQLGLARTRDEARRAAEAANADKMRFLAAMSHELRTPLNAIGGHVELMELGVHGPLTEPQRAALDRIQRNQRHLLLLINDVLNFAKLEAGRVEYDVADVRLADVVVEVLAMVDAQIARRDITTAVRIAPDLVARADRDKVGQILLNLLSNAIKFTDPGGEIVIDSPTRPDMGEPSVFIRVADTGCGIPRDRQDAIFEPFVQAHRSLSRPTEGTGLGLAISRDLARGMGGRLRVRSIEGEGASFTLQLAPKA